MKWPNDAHQRKVVRAFEMLGFIIIRDGVHISMERENADGTKTPLTLPNHKIVKGPTLRKICTQSKVSREEFLTAYNQS